MNFAMESENTMKNKPDMLIKKLKPKNRAFRMMTTIPK